MYESFSQDVKNEICAQRIKGRCCRASLLYGMIYGTNPSSEKGLFLESENPSVVMHYARLIKDVAQLKKDSDISLTAITDENKLSAIKNAIGVHSFNEFDSTVLKCEECKRSFLKGVFLTCGTVTYPENSYHMEFLVKGDERAKELSLLLSELGVIPKITERRGSFYGVYYKDSENVVDVLGYLGANKAAFKTLDVKIFKDIRNNANRIANCEAANIGKTVAASEAQMKAIERIIESGKSDELPDELRMTLDLRAGFPNATLKELAEMHNPPITKSGVNHRLKRLIDFSNNIK